MYRQSYIALLMNPVANLELGAGTLALEGDLSKDGRYRIHVAFMTAVNPIQVPVIGAAVNSDADISYHGTPGEGTRPTGAAGLAGRPRTLTRRSIGILRDAGKYAD
ncbi:MAG: hypothetical protein C5B50_12105 [Verrucomicrobia bacterium]|nr:MAG: hypothetical protein C5B50_12105 [Verrucomicrobiota bacterium]